MRDSFGDSWTGAYLRIEKQTSPGLWTEIWRGANLDQDGRQNLVETTTVAIVLPAGYYRSFVSPIIQSSYPEDITYEIKAAVVTGGNITEGQTYASATAVNNPNGTNDIANPIEFTIPPS